MGADPKLHKVNIKINQIGAAEHILRHIEYSLSLGLPEIPFFPTKHDGTAVIVGSGPSLKDQIENIRKEQEQNRPIVAINGAHDYLIENSITPDYFLTVDPRGMPQNFKHLNDKTIYLLASRVSPSDFDLLKGKKVFLFHTVSEESTMGPLEGKVCIGGGSTSGLRAIVLFYALGFRNIHLYGFDSCLGKINEKHVNETKGLPEHVQTMPVIIEGETFLCNMAMAAQADNFQDLYDGMPDVKIESFGEGLITAILAARRKQGLRA